MAKIIVGIKRPQSPLIDTHLEIPRMVNLSEFIEEILQAKVETITLFREKEISLIAIFEETTEEPYNFEIHNVPTHVSRKVFGKVLFVKEVQDGGPLASLSGLDFQRIRWIIRDFFHNPYNPNPIRESRLVGLLTMAVWSRGDAGEAAQARYMALKQINGADVSELPLIKLAFQEAMEKAHNQPGASEKLTEIWKEVTHPEFSKIPFSEIIAVRQAESRSKEYGVPDYQKRRTEIPPWQTDPRSIYNEVPEYAGFTNLNFCLRAIYQKSVELGGAIPNDWSLRKTTFWAFDGAFSRGVFTAFCSEAALHFGAEVMEKWNSTGGNPYLTKAVFATFQYLPGKILLLRLLGKNQEIWMEYESFNLNPWNDDFFTQKIRDMIEEKENKPKPPKKEHQHQPGDKYLITGITLNGSRFRLETSNLTQALGINLYQGNIWLIRKKRRTFLKKIWN